MASYHTSSVYLQPFENCSRGLEAPRVDLQPNGVNFPLPASVKEPDVTNNNVVTFGKKGLELVPLPVNISEAWQTRPKLTRSKTVYAFDANFQISKDIQIMDEHREARTASLSLSERLQGWTIEFRERENGTVDKFYHHKSSNCMLRSTIEVENFILDGVYTGPQWREHGVTEESHLARIPWFDSSEGESKSVSSKRRRTPSSIGNNRTKRRNNKTRFGRLDEKVVLTETIDVVPVQVASLHPLQSSSSAHDQPQISRTPEEMADGFFN